MPQTSKRGQAMSESPIRKLVPLANQAKARGTKVYHLNIGQPDIKTPEIALDALRKFDEKVLEYSPSDGIKSLKVKFAKYYQNLNIDVTDSDIFVTTGGSEAVNFAFLACLDPGDEVIIPEPAYANYTTFAQEAGVTVKPIISHIENGFALPAVEEFEKLITPKTKGILICNPNNPTGYLYTREEMEKLSAIVKKHNLFFFTDEVYREFCYTDAPHISAFHLEGLEENVVMIDSVSKRYSECGIRIGALVTKNKEVQKSVMKLAQARLSPPLLGQVVAEASLDVSKDYTKAVFDEYLSRRDCLVEGLNKIPGVYTPVPMGAFYTVARLPIDDSDKFCAWMLSDFSFEGKTVMMAPASGFYSQKGNGLNEVRMAYVLDKEDLKQALVVLAEALKVYPGRTN